MADVHGRSHRVLRIDLRGFGRTPQGDEAYSSAGDLLALLDRLGIERAGAGGDVDGRPGGARGGDRAAGAGQRAGAGVPGLPNHEWSATVRAYGEAEDAAIERGDVEQACELNVRMWVDGPAELLSRSTRWCANGCGR